MKTPSLSILALLFLGAVTSDAAITLADNGKAKSIIVRQAGATEAEKNAANELAQCFKEITGAAFEIQDLQDKAPSRAIIVGPGPLAKKYFPEVPFEQLGDEEVVVKTKGNRLLLAGGKRRGTLYAVNQFLQDECRVRWWTPWASHVPSTPKLTVKSLNVRYQPVFESRDPYWFPAFNREWAVRNFSNSQSAGIPPEWGGSIKYRGFVHTFNPLVPPEKHFAEHPEWYSLIKGKRTSNHSQLCLTNPKLKDFVVGRVKEWLKESPDARIVSVSQNDWYSACECSDCAALDAAEGSQIGTMLAFVNYIAEKIEPEFPQVAIDTLAYQYTRKPPKTLRPRSNVIIRLCSIECNFREPLSHPSNASFAKDIIGWSKICNRLYIWDYTTDFAHYVQPHPNWFVLGENVRFFRDHNVKGLFEQGAYQSYASEMTELRTWVLAQLLWAPHKDDKALIREFLEGYYGRDSAQYIAQYMEMMHQASTGYNLTCFSKTDTPFHHFKYMAEAEKLWDAAARAASSDPELALRVRTSRLPLGYVWLTRWRQLQKECADMGATWPLPASRKQYAQEWLKIADGTANAPWTKVRMVNESGVTPQKFVERFAEDPQ